MRWRFVMPADLPRPSGGSVYNDAVLKELQDAGRPVEPRRIPGTWPRPTPEHRRALSTALDGAGGVLIDGLIAQAAPEQILAAVDAGTTVHVLLHSRRTAEANCDVAGAREPDPDEQGPDGRGPEVSGSRASEPDGAGDGPLVCAERRALEGASGVICTSDWAARDLARLYQIGHLDVVTPGTEFAATAVGGEPPQLMVLGALTTLKNQSLVLAALAALTDLPWTLRLVGSGDIEPGYADALRAQAQRDFGPGRVELVGVRTGAELETIWNRTDLLLLTSLTETYGMVVAEALARGIPAVVSAGTGAVEALDGGAAGDPVRAPDGPDSAAPTGPQPVRPQPGGPQPGRPHPGGPQPVWPHPARPGAVVDPHDPDALADLLRRWLTDASLRHEWRAEALIRRDTLRTWATAADEMWRILSR